MPDDLTTEERVRLIDFVEDHKEEMFENSESWAVSAALTLFLSYNPDLYAEVFIHDFINDNDDKMQEIHGSRPFWVELCDSVVAWTDNQFIKSINDL